MKFGVSGGTAACMIAIGLVAGTASAEPARQPLEAEQDRSSRLREREAESGEFRPVAVELNPLSVIIGRYSLNVEILPARHHALVLNPHYDSFSFEPAVNAGGEDIAVTDGFSGYGAELGYRYYSGSRGPQGFFIGPSLLLGRYHAKQSDLTGSDEKSFTSVGWALDVGGQAIVGSGVVLGFGLGIQQTRNSVNADQFGELPLFAEALVGSGVRPRFLFSAGYAFD